MLMLYNSDNFAVVQFDVPSADAAGADVTDALPRGAEPSIGRGGFEIVDKFARREIFLEGAMAERFQKDVKALIETEPDTDEIDAFLGRFAGLAHQPVVLH
jgi:hypothetical protein